MISVCYYYDIKSGYIYTNERTNERRYPYIIYIYDIQICISYINSISVILYQKRRLRVHKDKRGAPSQCMHAIYAWRSARLAAHTRISGSNSPSQFGSNDKGSAHLAASRLARRPYRRISLASICSKRGARQIFQDIPNNKAMRDNLSRKVKLWNDKSGRNEYGKIAWTFYFSLMRIRSFPGQND